MAAWRCFTGRALLWKREDLARLRGRDLRRVLVPSCARCPFPRAPTATPSGSEPDPDPDPDAPACSCASSRSRMLP